MSDPILQKKTRRGRKDDSSLHEFAEEISRRREALGLPPVDNDFDPHKVIAEWHREQDLTPPWARRRRKKTSPEKNKRVVREFAIVIMQEPDHGYWAYCPAVNGKRLHGETMAEAWEKMTAYLGHRLEKLVTKSKPSPKTSVRIKK